MSFALVTSFYLVLADRIISTDFPLCSFLLNRRASTTPRSHAGLAAIDLIRPGPAGEVFRDVLQDLDVANSQRSSSPEIFLPAQSTANSPVKASSPRKHAKHQSLPALMMSDMARQSPRIQKREQARADLAVETAQNLQLDFSLLDISIADASFVTANAGLGFEDLDVGEGPSTARPFIGIGSEAAQDEPGERADFVWEDIMPDQMLSFSMADLQALLDLTIAVRPSRAADARHMPASVLFLAARYAAYFGGEDLLGELLLSALERIEQSVRANSEDLANFAFWLSNSLLLLYYLRRDPRTDEMTEEYQDNLQDLIREIYVICLRDVERRLDKILDACILDHSPLPGFDDVRFEGEWRFVKALSGLTATKQPATTGYTVSPRPTVQSIFGTPERSHPASLGNSPRHVASPLSSPRKLVRHRTPSIPVLGLNGAAIGSPQSPAPVAHTPRTITGILSSFMFVLQHYDYAGHPCIVVQAFSQLFYWMASELFNRIVAKVSRSIHIISLFGSPAFPETLPV